MAESEEEIAIEVQSLYQAVLNGKKGYEAEIYNFESAKIRKNLEDIQYQQGMVSRGEYLQEELTYLQSQSTLEAEKLSLVQAVLAYQWAIEGILDS